MRWWQAVNGGDQSRKYPKVWDGDMRLSIFDGVAETDVAPMPSGAHPLVDRMSDSRWLIAGSRADKGEKNGCVYSADGQQEHAMILGDGIENLLCSADGTIWVGYFDDGVSGGQNKDGSWPVSSGGIVHFDASGTPLWSFNQQVRDDHGYVAHCCCAIFQTAPDQAVQVNGDRERSPANSVFRRRTPIDLSIHRHRPPAGHSVSPFTNDYIAAARAAG